jgi:hypothetical protein
MAEAETEPDADTEEEQLAWAQQTPTTRIKGVPRGIIFGGTLDSSVAQNGPTATGDRSSGFGIVFEDVEVITGTLFENTERDGDDGLTESTDDHGRPTDYRIADPDDRDATIVKGSLTTDENGPNVYDESDAVSDEQTIVWYNGMAGERISRALDFNGLPYARWTDDGYLVKGLYQAAEEWRGANTDQRQEMKQNGLAPRVARVPVLRWDDAVTDEDAPEVLVDISRYRGGRGYEAHVFDAEAFEEEFGDLETPVEDIERDDYYQLETDAEFDWRFAEDADEVLDELEIGMRMYTGEGFQDEPADWSASYSSGTGDFEVETSTIERDERGLTKEQANFVEMVVGEMQSNEDAHGKTPNQVFRGGLEGLIERNVEAFDVVPSGDTVETIRRAVYEGVEWLDAEDLD